MELVRLKIIALSYSQTQSGAYALILTEENGNRKLPIVIGAYEAQAIAIALENEIKPPRPLTHDLFKDFVDHFDVTISEVLIHKLDEGVFYSSIVCEKDGFRYIMDARTSDAVAISLRVNCPIFTYESILEKAGIILDDDEHEQLSSDSDSSEEDKVEESIKEEINKAVSESSTASHTDYSGMSQTELEKALADAVNNEDYETAAKVRDELNRRS